MTLLSTRELIALQIRVVLSLVLREIRATFGASSFGYIWAFITPAAGVAFLVFIFSAISRQPPFGSSLALFFATGMLTLQFFNETMGKLTTSFNANRALLTYPPIKQVDTIVSRVILISLTFLVIMFAFYSGLIYAGLAFLPAYPEQVVLAFLATALSGMGFGLTSAFITVFWDETPILRFWDFLRTKLPTTRGDSRFGMESRSSPCRVDPRRILPEL